MKWTEAQERVINERNCNLLVSAAAGSGKTAVLVERIIKRLCDDEDKISLDRLLVMTFTRAAAEEMRERIGRAITEKLKAEPDNRELLLQKTMLPRAKIATIDSICQNLIKQHYQYLDIDPGFRVPDEGELNLIREDILKELVEECYASGDDDFMHFAEAFGGAGAKEKLSDIISRNAVILNSNPWPELKLKEQLRECEAEKEKRYEETNWFKYLWEDIKKFNSEYCRALEYAKELCFEPEGPLPYLENIEELQEIGEDIDAVGSYSELYELLKELEFTRLKIVKGKKYDISLKDSAKSIIDSYKKFLKEKLKALFGIIDPDTAGITIAMAAHDTEILLKLAGEFNKRFERKKREKNIVDFGDMEHLALRLLYEERDGKMQTTEIADLLSSQFDEILIDEYQDSNFVQEALVEALSGERFGRPNIFMVGDVKQSIYRFRLAKPEIFMSKYEAYGDSGNNIKIELNQNFRSRAEVISSVNSIFRKIMKKELGGIEYNEAQALKLGASYPESADKETELCLIDTKTETDGAPIDKDAYEARYIAHRINELVGGIYDKRGESRFEVTDKGTGNQRPVSYRDIVILMRAPGKRAEAFARELSYAGIPVYYENTKGYFEAPEIEIMLAYLNIIDNPNQDIPLTASMRSVIGDFSDSDLAYIRSVYNKAAEDRLIKPGNMYEALCYIAKECSAETEHEKKLQLKCIAFLEELNKYRSMSAFIPVHSLIHKIYKETGYYECMGAMPLGNIRKKNLDLLLKRAENYGSTGFHGLFSFVRYVERLKNSSSDYGEAKLISENEDIVRIVSIHKSKGLEYPIVFLAGISKQFNKQDQREAIVNEGDYGVAADYHDLDLRVKMPNLKKEALKRKSASEDLGEELRVLYVALTRAKEKLIMTGAVSGAEAKLKKYREASDNGNVSFTVISSANSYLDWVLMSGAESSHDIDIRIITAEEIDLYDADDIKERSAAYELLSDKAKETQTYDTGDRIVELIKKQLERKYKYEAISELRPKMSVSELREDTYIIEPSGEDETEKLRKKKNASLRGNAFHRFMELLDFRAFSKLLNSESKLSDETLLEFLKAEAERIIDSGRMLKEEAELLKPSAALGFFSSDTAAAAARAAEKNKLKREQRFMIGFKAGEKLSESIEKYIKAIKSGEVLKIEYDDEIQLLQGIADCIYEDENGGLVILDYKTDRVNSEEVLIKRYLGQLVIYAAAISQITGKKISDCIIYSTALQRTFSVLY